MQRNVLCVLTWVNDKKVKRYQKNNQKRKSKNNIQCNGQKKKDKGKHNDCYSIVTAQHNTKSLILYNTNIAKK